MALEASEIAVRVRLLGGSAFEREAQGIAKSTEAIGAAGRKANAGIVAGGAGAHNVLDKTGSKLKKVGAQVTGLGRSLTTMGVPLAAVGYYAVKSSAQFQQAMVLLATQAGARMKDIKGLSKSVQDLAPSMGATPLALAHALYPIESIGLRGPKAMQALKAAAIGSAVGLDSLANTADAVTTVIASHIKGAGGPVEAMSLMDMAIGRGKMHLHDLTDSFKSAIIPMAQTFGLSFKQILAAGSALTRLGIPASSVMARMRLSLTSMVSPTASGAKALAAMGLNQFQLAQDLRSPGGLLTALEDLKMHASGTSNPNNLIAEIFGKSRGMGQMAAMLNALPQMEQIYGTVMGTTPKTLMQHFGQTKDTSAFKFKQVQAAFNVGLIKLGDSITKYLLPALARLIPLVTSVVKWFGQLSPGMQKFLLIMVGLIIVGGPLAMFAGALISAGGAILGFIGWLTKADVAMGTAGLEGSMMSLRGGFLGLLGPLGLLAGTILLATNPTVQKYTSKVVDKVAGFVAGDSHFGANNSGKQYGYYAGFNTPPPGYAALVGKHRGDLNWTLANQNLLNQWWATRHEPAQLSRPMPDLHGGAFFGGLAQSVAGIGGQVGGGLMISVPVSLDGKVIAEAVARVNRGNTNRR